MARACSMVMATSSFPRRMRAALQISWHRAQQAQSDAASAEPVCVDVQQRSNESNDNNSEAVGLFSPPKCPARQQLMIVAIAVAISLAPEPKDDALRKVLKLASDA